MSESSLNQASTGRSAGRLLQEVLLFNDVLNHSLCRHLKINETDFNALQHLTFGKPLTPSGLAGKLGISSAAATALIDRLSERRQVVRTPHPSDRRSVLIHPSPETVELMVTTLRPPFNESSERLNDTAPEEQQAVMAFLEDVLQSIHVEIESLPATHPAKRRERS